MRYVSTTHVSIIVYHHDYSYIAVRLVHLEKAYLRETG